MKQKINLLSQKSGKSIAVAIRRREKILIKILKK